MVRTSVFRLVKEDWLETSRNGRESSYQLTKSGRRRLSYAYERVYARRVDPWEGTWTLILVGSDELSPQQRQELRQELQWQGLRQLAPHLFGHPRIQSGLLAELLDRLGVRKQVISFCNARTDKIASGDLQELIHECWDVPAVVKHYRGFLRRFERAGRILEHWDVSSPQQWFVIRILMVHTFRRLVLQDPLLPEELLPKPWIGNNAYQLAGKIYRLSLPASEIYVANICGFDDVRGREGTSILGQRFR